MEEEDGGNPGYPQIMYPKILFGSKKWSPRAGILSVSFRQCAHHCCLAKRGCGAARAGTQMVFVEVESGPDALPQYYAHTGPKHRHSHSPFRWL